MSITYKSNLDMVSGGIPVVVHVGQYDDDFSIVFTPFASTGSFSIPSGTTAEVRGTKRDRNGYSASATVDTTVTPATVTVTGDVQMTAIAGSNVFELVLTKDDKVLSSANFILQVEHAAMDAETVASESVIREISAVVDDYLEDHDTALLAKKVNTPLSGGEADYGTAGQVLSTLGDGTTEWVDAAQGGGLTDEAKDALLACFAHVAWIDDDGQDYYDALDDALYPPADLVSISAVYTQSGTVYDTDTLDSLKADLVVTATYSDSTTATVTTYTLSGTLAEGTSTITVSYGGKTTTFNVTVTEYAPLYALEDAVNDDTDYKITTTKGGHVKIEFKSAMSSSDTGKAVNIYERLLGNLGGGSSVINNRPKVFTIPKSQQCVYSISNVTNTTGLTGSHSLGLRKANSESSVSDLSISGIGTGNSKTATLSAAADVGCPFLYLTFSGQTAAANSVYEFDMSLTVNGVRWI